MSRLKRMMAAVLGTSLLVPLVPSAAQAMTRARVDEPVVKVHVIKVNGSGCPTDSSVVTGVPDETAFTVSFSQFRAYGGGYKNCVVSIDVSVPAGWTYAVYEVDNRGWGVLDQGASGRLVMSSWFTGFPWTLKADQTFKGPLDDFWQTTSTADSLTYSPCGASANLLLNNTLRVTGPATSSMELFAQDLRVSTVFRLKLKQC
jgi:Domain of unknown function (DUF4360)